MSDLSEEDKALNEKRDATNETALKYAEQVAKAIGSKLPEHKVFTRLITAPEYNYIELGIQQLRGSVDVATVAYSDAYFIEMSDVAEKGKRAQRIWKDVRITLGIRADA